MHIKISINKFKNLTILLGFAFLFGGVFGFASQVEAQTVQFNKDLYRTISAEPIYDVRLLQSFLQTQGFYTGTITGNYLTATYQAVVKFQNTYGITPATGYFGTTTREKANSMLSASPALSAKVIQGAVGETTTSTAVATPTVTVKPTTINTTYITPTTFSTQTTVAPTTQPNLILNPSMETANGTSPLNWFMGKWGTLTSIFSYPVAGQDGTKAVKLQVTSYTSGDAKWFFSDVNVTPGATYTFSEYYKSNVVTNVTIRWTKTDGTKTYQSLGNPGVATNWTQRTNTFTIPAGVKSMTIFHLLKSTGTLEIDNFKLVSGSGTTSLPTPVDATVSAWGAWGAVSAWSACANGTQTRTEERVRTVLTVALNGGVTPALKELRTVTQTCSMTNTGSTSPLPTTPTQPTTPSGSTLNFSTKEWGVYTGWGDSDLTNFENAVGKSAEYRAVFIHWGNENAFPMKWKTSLADKGKTLVIFWEATNYNVGTVNQPAYSYDAVIKGNFDSYFKQFATDAKTYGGDVILIPFSEMNGDWFPWSITQNGNTPQKHIDAWRRIHGFFKDTPNVKFGWAPNQASVPNTSINQFENFYPGDAYVDYVGLDGFNFGSPWLSFDELFGKQLARMKVYKKPIYIFSFASASGASKPAWITDALKVQIPKYPEIKGWIWFNENKERDWRVNADTTVLNAFKVALP